MNPRTLSSRTFFPIILAAILALPAQTVRAQAVGPRFALVIGNGNYSDVTRLANPANDAADIGASLKDLGFQVEILTDRDLPSMEEAVVRLGNRLAEAPSSTGFFFYAGHGVQSNGKNYLIPVDSRIAGEAFLKTKALALQSVLDTLQESRNRLNVVVLDACRDNPFSWARSGTRGLAVVSAQPPGTIVVYATSAGSKALDGTGRNGTFTGELLKNLKTPGLEIKDMFNRTGAGVKSVSGGRQIPAVYNQFFDSAYLAGAAPGSGATEAAQLAAQGAAAARPMSAAAGSAAPAAQPTPSTGVMTVQKAYGSIQVQVKMAGHLFVDGEDKGELPAGGIGTISGVETGSRTVEVRYGDGQVERGAASVELDKTTPITFSRAERPEVPEGMVRVDGGAFQMGSNSGGSNEQPVHAVTVSSFLIGKYEVTQKEWQEVMGFNPSSFKGDNLPVENVSWFDAVDYCNKRSQREGLEPFYTVNGTSVNCDFNKNGYRLPTEAEWEYAARGGMKTKGYTYSGSNTMGDVAWFGSFGGNSNWTTHPVGTKAPNELGLYDMSGNVCEWCWDRYGSYSSGAQTDPTGASSGSFRVLRGGGWGYVSSNCRSSYRDDETPDYRYFSYGLRVARSAR